MPVFEYTALNSKGKKTSGIIDAGGMAEARRKLRDSGGYPTSLKELSGARPKKKVSLKKIELSRYLTRVGSTDIAVMTRQLSTLLGAGIPLVSAFETLIPQTKSKALKRTLAQTKNSIVEGGGFAQALESHPGVFSPLYINMVRAGEASGELEIVLDRLADLTEKQDALSSRVKGALYYPAFMSVVGFLVLFALMGYVVPRISAIFEDMNQALPLPTVFLIGASALIRDYWWLFAVFFGCLAYGARMFIRTKRGRYFLDIEPSNFLGATNRCY